MPSPGHHHSSTLPQVALIALVLAVGVADAANAQGTRLLRDPDVGPNHIAFVHANDIWLVGRDGGDALRLTSGEGAETDPAFSPDGRWIAFTGEYGGDVDVYVVLATGGEPRRLTWHPGADVAQGWTSDGRVLFQSGREGAPTGLWRFYTVGLDGGLPTPLALPQAYQGEMSADGAWLAYQEIGYWDPEWRNYRGGQAQPVSVVSTQSWERVTPPWEGERQMAPVWLDGVVYYMSERDWASNVWSWNPETGEEKQVTFHADFDVKSLGAGYGVVVYEQGGYLHELNPATGATRQLDVRVARDRNWARPRWEDVSVTQLRDARLSPTGARALFEYRGELFTVPAEEGSWRNITRSPGVADRHAVWSPDGQRIAWFNDEGGEYGLMVADQGGGDPRRIDIPNPTFFFVPTWSPDGTRLAFTDTDYRVLILDLASGDLTHVDTDRYAHPQRTMNPVWSPDSRWLAYARRLDNQLRAIFVYDTGDDEAYQLTDGMADAISPVWDASGKYLYFLASTDYALNTGWLDMTSYDRPVTRALYLALLKSDEPSPFLPQSDEEAADGEDADEERSGRGSRSENAAAETPDVAIDFDGIASRIVDAPGLPERNYLGLVEGPEGRIFVAEAVPNERGFTLHRYTLKDREVETFLESVNDVTASHDRKKLLYRSGSDWTIVDAVGGPPRGNDGRLSFSGLRVRVEPRAEWAQMLRDGWRFMRDFLYVDNVHGAPWDDVWEWYSPWLADVYHRSDFNHLLDILSGEVAVGHSYVRGGDYPDLTDPRTGLLGVDIEEAGEFYRITRIYSGEDWTPGLTGPLAMPGLGVHEGDYLLAIDGRELRVPTNPFMLLEGTTGRTIAITVNGRPNMDGARKLIVEPISSERTLRSWAWVEGNRRKVDEMSDGRLAYVYLPNTGRGGYSYFNRMYFAQQDRQGAVIDERNNGGGSAADYIVDVLGRELTGYFNSRAGDRKPFTQPMAGLWGPKVMIINERSGSGGDLLPYLFHFKQIGPLVGTRTWGGLVGTWDTPPLLDGGRFVAPRGGFFDVNGEWAVEGEGVPPDIEVRNDPKPVIEGRDPQLEAAVQEALRLLETEGFELKPEPPAPVRWRRPGRQGG
ncbi:MAG TPA: PDZ domain-containing protein [Gemmatimonadota bacterium]|nr:PDZ domain-containing protein [Gemmatimonadota bacterium]